METLEILCIVTFSAIAVGGVVHRCYTYLNRKGMKQSRSQDNLVGIESIV